MAVRVLSCVGLLVSLAFSQDVSVDSALAADDACGAHEECSLKLLQRRHGGKEASQPSYEQATQREEEDGVADNQKEDDSVDQAQEKQQQEKADEEDEGELDADGCRQVCTTRWRYGRRVKTCHRRCGYYLMQLSESENAAQENQQQEKADEEDEGELDTDGCRQVCTSRWRYGRRVKTCHRRCGYYLMQLSESENAAQEKQHQEKADEEDEGELDADGCRQVCTTRWRYGRRVKTCHRRCR